MSHYDFDADVVMGHEYVAEIVDYGPDTQRKWAKGATRVSSIPALIPASVGSRSSAIAPKSLGGFWRIIS